MSGDLGVVFDAEVVDDKALALDGVLAHVEAEHLGHAVLFVEAHAVEADVGSDKAFEFVGGYFAEALEAGYLGLVAETCYGGYALFVGVAVVDLLLVVGAFGAAAGSADG